jgi:hypothetical protein
VALADSRRICQSQYTAAAQLASVLAAFGRGVPAGCESRFGRSSGCSEREGKTKRETIRCLKRYLVREIYRIFVPIITPEGTWQT